MYLAGANTDEEIADRIIKIYEDLRGRRGNLESHCQEIAERIWPSHSKQFQGQRQAGPWNEGDKRQSFQYDSTGAVALNRFSAILDSLLTPATQQWHRLVPDNAILKRDRETTLWFEDVTRIMFKYRYAPAANFAAQNQLSYKAAGAWGTGILYSDKLRDARGLKGLRYRSIHLAEMFIKENFQGIVDFGLRKFPLEARQLVQQYKDKNVLPAPLIEKAKSDPMKEYWVLHLVCPRHDYDPQRKDVKGKYFASYEILIDGKKMLSEDGFDAFPFGVTRYEQVPGETYGRSPAMDVLPSLKTLNEQKKTVLTQGHRAVSPVLLAHDDGILDTFSMRPGAINYGGVSSDGRPLVHALPVGNLAVGKDMMDDERGIINDAFLVTIFQILVENPQMTATEVIERVKEKGILLSPTIGRIQSEYLGPMIEREFDLLAGQDLIPPLPQMLIDAAGEYQVTYDSPLSRTQRAEQASGAMRTLESAMAVAAQTQNPAVMDIFKLDVIYRETADISGMPASWLNGEDEIAQIREGRQKQMAEQQAVQAAPGAAALIKSSAVAQKEVVN